MQARHALQAAALQFGRDGTDKSLDELVDAWRRYRDERLAESFPLLSDPATVTANDSDKLPAEAAQ